MTTHEQASAAIIPYEVDWSSFLTATGDTIATSTWDEGSGTLTIADSGVTDGIHACTITGGATGSTYRVTSRITTTGGLLQEQSFAVTITST